VRILVAGIGNVFLGDDGFGVEVVGKLAQRQWPDGIEIADFGIRGFDLAYALMEDYDAAILVDAVCQNEPPGTVFVIEPDLDRLEGDAAPDGHTMNPVQVLLMVRQFGGSPPKRLLLVGCEPESLGGEHGEMGLTAPVTAAVDEAVRTVESLLDKVVVELSGARAHA
jgi:hydrogenase maturation protease